MEQLTAGSRKNTGICPVCRARIEGAQRACPSCDTVHHLECWDLVGQCAIYGCFLPPRPVRRPRLPEPLPGDMIPPRPGDVLAFLACCLALLVLARVNGAACVSPVPAKEVPASAATACRGASAGDVVTNPLRWIAETVILPVGK